MILFGKRQAIRSPENPLDRSTIVSIYPKPIHESKLTVQPGEFYIPAGSVENPGILVIGSSSWWKDTHPDEPLLEIQISSVVMAESVVKDFCNAVLCSDGSNCMPGLFFIPGVHSVADIKKDHSLKLTLAKNRQDNWLRELVKSADVDWARTNGNPIAIPDEARLAAEMLGIKNKPWMQDFRTFELKNCPACGNLINPTFPVCPHCKVIINKDKFKELGLVVAQ